MDLILTIVGIVAFLLILLALPFIRKKKKAVLIPLPDEDRQILNAEVLFYKELPAEQQRVFEQRMQLFLSRVRITGVGCEVTTTDRVLVGASAIIPIFGFPEWEYNNLDEVLLYPDAFNHRFNQEGGDRNILGVVGEGAYEDLMILSQHDLRQGFANRTAKTNTAIHEFVHLLDKTDGEVDGIPESLLPHQYITPWLDLMQREIKKIRSNDSDINPYGATNRAEFFAVVAEYFFERPELLQEKNPGLYDLLSKIFRQQPDMAGK